MLSKDPLCEVAEPTPPSLDRGAVLEWVRDSVLLKRGLVLPGVGLAEDIQKAGGEGEANGEWYTCSTHLHGSSLPLRLSPRALHADSLLATGHLTGPPTTYSLHASRSFEEKLCAPIRLT